MKLKFSLLLCFISCSSFALEIDQNREIEINNMYEELEYTFDEPFILQNPYKRNALSALVKFPTKQEAQIELQVLSKEGKPEITHTFSEYKKEHEIPVLGLYPNSNNKVLLTAKYKDGTSQTTTLSIPTKKADKRALFTITNKKDEKIKYHYLHGGIVFDEKGTIRLDFKPEYEMLYFLNGSFVGEDRNKGLIQYNILGKKEKVYTYPAHFTSFTHGLTQKPNKNFLVIGSFDNQQATVGNQQTQTQREFVIELDYQTGKMVNKIDLAQLLNPDRSVIIKSDTQNYGLNNWCHINSVDYNSEDESIVVSCRHVGLVKINEKTKELDFVIAPHKGFEKSGRDGSGPDLSNKLLTALDKMGDALPDSVQQGTQSYPDFKWPTKTHDAKTLGDGIYSIFDNSGPLYDKTMVTSPHSNAQVFKIDEKNKTIQSLWFEPLAYHSESGSSVLYNPNENEVTVYLSIVKDPYQQGIATGKLIRYDLTTHEKLFEATLYRGGETYFYGLMPFSFYQNEGLK
ncbi:MAG: aryl-sulfate sulfotransferase [Alphaproteobacteria bacterium]|nr:aryl-sulfate sulfotransferase [Alphaproteobacteria bacterium]